MKIIKWHLSSVRDLFYCDLFMLLLASELRLKVTKAFNKTPLNFSLEFKFTYI